MKRKVQFLFLIVSILMISALSAFSKSKIKVLLLSGSNNHKWKETTPALKSILDRSGLFEVTITENPETVSTDMLKNYQLILSNWNLFPEKNSDWSEETKNAVLEFVSCGGGFVFVHAASSVNYDWQEYQEMAGATWGENTKHGKVKPFEVIISGVDHPVTKGMSNFWTTDELWVNMENFKTCNTLAEAFSSLDNNGRGEMEPVILAREYGKGRSFFIVLGHTAEAMTNLGFQTLLLRGAEWAAKGKVSQKIPKELAERASKNSSRLKWDQGENSLALLNNKEVVWQYNFAKSEGKPFFHPLSTIDGSELTWLRPEDHPWHRAVWFSWKFINGLNYWEEDRKTRESKGITDLKSVDYSVSDNFEADIKLRLTYHPPGKTDLLNESRTIHVSPPNESGSYYLDWESTFTAIADEVVLDRTPLPHEPNGKRYGGYAGFSTRLNKNLWDVNAINDDGKSDDLHGQSSKWMTYAMRNLKGEPVSFTIFDHPENPKHPNKWYVEKSLKYPFYYFSPAMLFDSKLVLKKGETFQLRYRLLISPDELSQVEIESNWENFKTK